MSNCVVRSRGSRLPCSIVADHGIERLAAITATTLAHNQVELIQIDRTASDNRPEFRMLRISPRSLEAELEAMLNHRRLGRRSIWLCVPR